MSNKLGKRKHVEKPGRIGFQVLSHQKKTEKKTRALEFNDGPQ